MKALVILFFMVFSLSAFAQDMQKYLSETQEMVTQKKYPEALERYIWFQNHSLEYDLAMTGVRLSFALSDWKELADEYPPALTAMKEMRDTKTKAIIDSNQSTKLFSDVVALNRTLEENNKSIELFETIAKTNPDKAKSCWYWIKDALFDAKRYDLIKNFVGNPVNEFDNIKSQYDLINSMEKNNKNIGSDLKSYHDNSLVEKSLQLIQFSISINDIESAKEIRKKAMDIVKDNRLRDVLIPER